MIRELTYLGNPILRRRADEVNNIDAHILQLIQDMEDTLMTQKGVGLAAPQIGESLRIFISTVETETSDGELVFFSKPQVFINPKLTNPGSNKVIGKEGCLSIPGLRGYVARPDSITVTALNLQGEEFVMHLTGFAARVVMHENDHLNGVLYIDRMENKDDKKFLAGLERVKRRYASTYSE